MVWTFPCLLLPGDTQTLLSSVDNTLVHQILEYHSAMLLGLPPPSMFRSSHTVLAATNLHMHVQVHVRY